MKFDSTLDQLSVHVIAVNKQPRNTNLINCLRSTLVSSSIFVESAVTPNVVDATLIQDDITRAQILLGRDVTALEICVAQSHQICYSHAVEHGTKFALIFEDDVALVDKHLFAESLKKIYETSDPTIWTLYSPNWSIWKISNGVMKSVFPPPCAACYVINESAMKIALSGRPIGVADWPMWANRVNFEMITNTGICLTKEDSYIEIHRKDAKLNKHQLRSLFSPLKLLEVPISARFRSIILYPLIWKLSEKFSSTIG